MVAVVTPEEAPIPSSPSARDAKGMQRRSARAGLEDDPEFAELLAAAEREGQIPLAAFAAIVEVLAYLYRLDAGRSK
jgi:hypothetical protein